MAIEFVWAGLAPPAVAALPKLNLGKDANRAKMGFSPEELPGFPPNLFMR
jgi:hypothetical protein